MTPAPPIAWYRSRWLRLALLLAVGAASAHWLWERERATSTAAAAQGAFASLAACLVDGRPPDAADPDSARIIQQQLFRRLALSLPGARPPAGCAPLAATAAARAREHQQRLYHRAPVEVRELVALTARLEAFDTELDALELSRRRAPEAPPSPTLGLISDLARGLQLACQIAQAERAFETGACPTRGETRALPSPRTAFVTELPEPVERFELRARSASDAQATLAVSLMGRRGSRRHWVALEPPPGGAGAGWTALAPADSQAYGASRVAWRGELLAEASDEGLRLLELSDEGTLRERRALPKPGGLVPALGEPALWPLGAGAAWLTLGRAGAQLSVLTGEAPSEAVLLPGQLEWVGAHGVLLSQEGAAGRQLRYVSSRGEALGEASLRAGELSWRERAISCADGQAQLTTAGDELFLLTVTERTLSSHALPRQTPSPTLICDRGAPKLFIASPKGASVRDPITGGERHLSPPVAFDAQAAATITALGGPQGLVVSYLLGGVLVAQRLTPQGVSEPVELARPNERGAPVTPQLFLRPGGAWLAVFRRLGGSTPTNQLRLEALESADGLSWR